MNKAIPAPASELAERTSRVQRAMAEQNVDYLVVGPSPDLVYLIDFGVRQSERLTMLVIPQEGETRLVMPGFETPRVANLAATIDPVTWNDGEDPFQLLTSVLTQDGKPETIAIGPQMFTHFFMGLERALKKSRYVDGTEILEPLRMRKSEWELEQLAAASHAADATFEALIETTIEGATELEIHQRIHELLIEKGHEAVGGGIVGAGPNGASPHHHSSEARISSGTPVVVDFGGTLNNYRSDMTRTFYVGEPTQEFRDVYRIVDEANQKAFEYVRPGVQACDVDAVARDYIAKAGYPDAFLHRLGHGIGLEGHEPPYLVQGNNVELEEGMTVSIEPGIYLKGKFGVRIEDIAVVRANGAARLNLSSHELHVL